MNYLRTATGKEYACDFMGVAIGYDVLYVKLEIDLNEALTIFQNPEETEVLTWIDDRDGSTIRSETGYTDFGGFIIMRGKCPVRIRMQKPFSNGGI